MSGVIPGQVDRDFETFTGPSPEQMELEMKRREKMRKEMEKAQPKKKPPTDTQIRAAEKLAEKMKNDLAPEDELKKRTQLARRINKYVETFPERIECKVPKNVSAKMSLEQLQAICLDVEADLGMSGGVEAATLAYAEGMQSLETVTMDLGFNPLGLNLRNLGAVVNHPEGKKKWQPILREMVIKYEHLFSFGVEWRLIAVTASLVLTVHRTNEMSRLMQQNAGVPIPEELRKMKEELED